VGGLAARLAGERYLGLTLNRIATPPISRRRSAHQGTADEGAQLLATIPDALLGNTPRACCQLQADAPSMGWPFVKRRMASELGPIGRSGSGVSERGGDARGPRSVGSPCRRAGRAGAGVQAAIPRHAIGGRGRISAN